MVEFGMNRLISKFPCKYIIIKVFEIIYECFVKEAY